MRHRHGVAGRNHLAFRHGAGRRRDCKGVALLIPAGLVGFLDVCLPSMLVNAIVYRRLKPRRP